MIRSVLIMFVALMLSACANNKNPSAPAKFKVSAITVKAPAPENFIWSATHGDVTRPRDCSLVEKQIGDTEYNGYPEETIEGCEAAKVKSAIPRLRQKPKTLVVYDAEVV